VELPFSNGAVTRTGFDRNRIVWARVDREAPRKKTTTARRAFIAGGRIDLANNVADLPVLMMR
jgi:hypothetical protein